MAKMHANETDQSLHDLQHKTLEAMAAFRDAKERADDLKQKANSADVAASNLLLAAQRAMDEYLAACRKLGITSTAEAEAERAKRSFRVPA